MSEQGTDEWREERAGKITASMMHVVMLPRERAAFKSGPRAGQPKPQLKAITDYAHQLAAERLTSRPRKQLKAAALQWGKDVEPAAVAAYQAETGELVTLCGFIQHPHIPFVGASPDFLVGEDGGGEIKSPESSEVHLETLLTGLPPEHVEQIQGGLWATERKWWDFVSYHPDFEPDLRLYIQRVNRDDIFIGQLERACYEMERDVLSLVEQARAKAR
jgi:hypothetical protein